MLTAINQVEVSESKSLLPIKLVLSWMIVKWHEPSKTHDGDAVTTAIEGSILHRPATAREDYSKGTVMCIGPGEPGMPIEVEPGQEVMYFRHEARPIAVEGKEYDLVTYSQMISIL